MTEPQNPHSLTEDISGLAFNVSNFIESKVISSERTADFSSVIGRVEKKRREWALNDTCVSRTDSIVVYGAYKAISSTLQGIQNKLRQGIIKKENPVSAELVFPLFEYLINVADALDSIEERIDADQKVSLATLQNIDELTTGLYHKGRFLCILPSLASELETADKKQFEKLSVNLYSAIVTGGVAEKNATFS